MSLFLQIFFLQTGELHTRHLHAMRRSMYVALVELNLHAGKIPRHACMILYKVYHIIVRTRSLTHGPSSGSCLDGLYLSINFLHQGKCVGTSPPSRREGEPTHTFGPLLDDCNLANKELLQCTDRFAPTPSQHARICGVYVNSSTAQVKTW